MTWMDAKCDGWVVTPRRGKAVEINALWYYALRLLEGFPAHLDEACVGSVSEVFDAVPPFTARGCVAQVWSVAEVLRCRVLTSEHDGDDE